jgi:Tfp pilus assembly protein PilX
MTRRSQSGMTLVMALVMLVVLTLLVVSAIRFGNIGLKIAGNVQAEAEAAAAAQVALESTIATMAAGTTSNISTVVAQPAVAVNTGGQTYTVAVTAPGCVYSKQVSTDTLDPAKVADRACFEGSDADKLLTATGTLTVTPSACKDQQWDVTATVADTTNSGARVTMLQGAAVRVGAQVNCP